MGNIQTLQRFIDESRRIVAFTGAGCSTESGIPDFRSPGGLFGKIGTTAPISTDTVILVPIFS